MMLKYKDPVTKEFKNIYMGSAESIPVGTVLEYEGDVVPQGFELVEEQESTDNKTINIMTVKNIGKQTFPAETYTKINLTNPASIGDKLIAYNGGIKIGPGVSKVKISCYATIMSGAIGGCHLRLIRNELNSDNTVGWLIDRITAVSGQITVAYPASLMDVSEGETYYIYVYTPGPGQVGPDEGTMSQANLTIEVIE